MVSGLLFQVDIHPFHLFLLVMAMGMMKIGKATLAMSHPVIKERTTVTDTADLGMVIVASTLTLTGIPFGWLGKMEDFGLFLGASYEGYGDRVMALLSNIEASSSFGCIEGDIQQNREVKPRVARELKNMISNINYGGRNSMRRTSNTGRALMLSQ